MKEFSQIEKLPWQCSADECDRPKEGMTDFCASHNTEARRGLKSSIRQEQKIKAQKVAQSDKSRHRRPRIAQVSDKRRMQLSVYFKLLKAWIIGKICGCCKSCPATECHHMKGRENELLLLVEFWLPVCHDCHTKITKDSAWAIEGGFSLSRNKIN